jgi:hypothetical protein
MLSLCDYDPDTVLFMAVNLCLRMKTSRSVETSKAAQSMTRRLIPGELNPEQRYSDEIKFRKGFVPAGRSVYRIPEV